MLRSIALQSLVVTGFVALSASAGEADLRTWGDELQAERYAKAEESLIAYGDMIGQAMACHSYGPNRWIELEEKMAAWRYPGVWDWITGRRAEYQAELHAKVGAAVNASGGSSCVGIPATYPALLARWEGIIEGWMN